MSKMWKREALGVSASNPNGLSAGRCASGHFDFVCGRRDGDCGKFSSVLKFSQHP
jgi:hypothetical protein